MSTRRMTIVLCLPHRQNVLLYWCKKRRINIEYINYIVRNRCANVLEMDLSEFHENQRVSDMENALAIITFGAKYTMSNIYGAFNFVLLFIFGLSTCCCGGTYTIHACRPSIWNWCVAMSAMYGDTRRRIARSNGIQWSYVRTLHSRTMM